MVKWHAGTHDQPVPADVTATLIAMETPVNQNGCSNISPAQYRIRDEKEIRFLWTCLSVGTRISQTLITHYVEGMDIALKTFPSITCETYLSIHKRSLAQYSLAVQNHGLKQHSFLYTQLFLGLQGGIYFRHHIILHIYISACT